MSKPSALKVSIPISTIVWWRKLVDLNPQDLAPRFDELIERTTPDHPPADRDGLAQQAKEIARGIITRFPHGLDAPSEFLLIKDIAAALVTAGRVQFEHGRKDAYELAFSTPPIAQSGERDAVALADEIEQSQGLMKMIGPGQGAVQLGIKKTAMIVAALRPTTAGRAAIVEECAKKFDAEADNARVRLQELNRYSDDHEERAAWRSWKDKEDDRRYCAATVRALSGEG